MSGKGRAQAAFAGRRITGQRRLIAGVVDEMQGAFTVDELAERVREASSTGAGSIATVYRAVGAMEESGYIERVGSRDGQVLFARCHLDHHHHHVVCERCGSTAEAECTVDTASLARSGFILTRHEVTLYGLCPACSGERRRC